MLGAQSSRPRGWNTAQACIVALTALVAGGFAGYLLRSSSGHATGPSVSARAQHLTAPSPGTAVAVEVDDETKALLSELNRDPKNPATLAKLGYVYYTTKRFSQAAEYYRRSVEADDDPVVRVELGRAYFYAGDFDRAQAAFECVLKGDPANADGLFDLGMVKWKGKADGTGAVAAWRELLRKHPNHPRRAEIEELIRQAQRRTAVASR